MPWCSLESWVAREILIIGFGSPDQRGLPFRTVYVGRKEMVIAMMVIMMVMASMAMVFEGGSI